jgi:hypothetical protein
MVCVPAFVDVKGTKQLAVAAVPVGMSTHTPKGATPPSAVKFTLPVGALFVPLAVSATTAVQVVDPFACKEDGVQLTVVVVERFVTVTEVLPLLDAWVASPW